MTRILIVMLMTFYIQAVEGLVYIGDLNNDGVDDKIESDDLASFGNGGGAFMLSISSNGGIQRYRIEGNGIFRLEKTDDWFKLWYYWRTSAYDGALGYHQVTIDGIQSKSITINPGDGGTDLGKDLYELVLSKEKLLSFAHIKNYTPPIFDGK